MSKPRYVEVTDPQEAELLIYNQAGREFPHVSVAGDGRVWADADELRAWREKREREAQWGGPCAKLRVRCIIVGETGTMYAGENDCANPQPACPRAPGEGYEKCQTICQQAGHAEIEALKVAGDDARNGEAHVYGHYYACEPCARALRDAGVRTIVVHLA